MKKVSELILKIVSRIILIVWALTIIFPLVWMIYSSFKNNQEFYASPWSLPGALRFENYVYAWEVSNFSKYFLNSFIVVVGSLILFTLMTTTTSYILAKYRFRGRKFIETFFMASMMIPAVLLLMPRYFHLLSLKLTDNLFILMLIYAIGAVPGSVFLMVSFMRSVDNSFIEAAVMDGASEWTIFTKIMIPFTTPIIFLTCLRQIMGSWNDFTTALTYIKNEELYTVPVGLSYLTNSMTYHAEYGPMFAGLVLTMLPILVLYGVFQKQLIQGTMASDGVKG